MALELSNYRYDFLGRFYKLALVNIVSNVLIPISSLISVTFLGHLESINVLTGVSIVNILFGFIYFIFEFLRMSTTGLTAQAVGADDHEQTLLIGLRNGLVALVLGLLLLACQYPLREIGFWLLNIYPEVKAAGLSYFNARIWGAPAVLVNFVLFGWLLGREKNSQVLLLSILSNITIVLCDYLLVIRLGWGGKGAGTSQVIGQYLILLIGFIFAAWGVTGTTLKAVFPRLLNLGELKKNLALNRDLLIRTTTEIIVFTILGKLNTMMGAITFTQNSLIGQIGILNVYLTGGMGFATETLAGSFQGNGTQNRFPALLKVSVLSSIILTLTIASICALFPERIFSLLTNHTELTGTIKAYDWWLMFILPFTGTCSMIEGFFLGLAQGKIVRNVSVVSALFGFLPVASLFLFVYRSNHVFWFSTLMFRVVKMVALIIYLIVLQEEDGHINIRTTVTVEDI